MGATQKLAQFVTRTNFSDLSPETIEYTKRLALSWVGAALGGSTLSTGKVVDGYIRGIGGKPEATVIGRGFRTSAEGAAFANGANSHAIEYEDDSFPEGVSTYTVWPVVFALGEKLGSSGKEVIESFVLGFEVQSKMAMNCMGSIKRGFLNLPLLGNFGAAIAAAKLLKLNIDQTKVAMSLAASSANGLLRQVSQMAHYLENGIACRNGIAAAMLASGGATADTSIIEGTGGFCDSMIGEGGYDLDKMVSKLGNPFRVHFVGIKKYPCCYLHQRVMDGVLELMSKHKFKYDQVKAVTVEINPLLADVLAYPDPTTADQSKFSVEHGVAAVLLGENLGRETFTDRKAVDPRLRAARKKVRVITHPEWERGYQTGTNPVTIELNDGTIYKKECLKPRGEPPGKELTREEVEVKFFDCASLVLTKQRSKHVAALVWDLENMKEVRKLLTRV